MAIILGAAFTVREDAFDLRRFCNARDHAQPPQRRHVWMSIAKTRLSRGIQVMQECLVIGRA
jgi:hypothetical protein